MKNAYTFIGVGLVALALAGCVGGGKGADPSAPTDDAANVSTVTFADGLLTYEPTKEGDGYIALGAQYVGELSFENGCLLVGGAPFVFPREGTTWDGTTLTVNGNEFVVGDQITVGGGGLDGLKLPENAPEQCGGQTPIFVSTIDSKS